MDSQLFRKQALEAQSRPWLGHVHLATPVSHTIWTLAAACVGCAVVCWLLIGRYTRHQHVLGSLVPQAGLIEAVARNAGTVSRLYVEEGATVRAGDPLLALSGERSSRAFGETEAAVSSQLRSQQSRLQKDLLDVQQLAAQQKAGLLTQEAMLDGQLHELDAQLTIAGLQATSSRNLLERIRPLAARGYVSAFQIQAQEDQALAADSQLKSLRRQRYEISQQSSNVRNQLLQLPLVTEGKLSDLHRQLAQVEQSLAQNEADRESIMRATQDGIISSTLVRPGQAISAGQALLTVVPANSPLYAELFAPSSAIGFVHTGTRVVLHYQAFPYQKFGLQRGVVEGISRNALTPNEVAMMIGQQAPNEALYRVLVKLESQTIQAYGKPESLRPGMILDADLLLDRRRLIEWIFEPLFGMHRRVEVEGQSVEKASQERTP